MVWWQRVVLVLAVTAVLVAVTAIAGPANTREDGFCGGRMNCPTRNMSYDLRGEAAYPPRRIVPFLYSTIGPEDPACQCAQRGIGQN